MPSTKNVKQLEVLIDKLQQAKSLVLADYRGLNVNQIQELRQQVREAGGELLVAKNTLTQLALEKLNFSIPTEELAIFTGPTILLFAYEDEIAPLKTLADFAKTNDLPEIKAGFLGQDYLDQEKASQLAQLPSKEDLIAKVVGLINSPRVNLVFVLRANLQKLVMVIKAIANGGEK